MMYLAVGMRSQYNELRFPFHYTAEADFGEFGKEIVKVSLVLLRKVGMRGRE